MTASKDTKDERERLKKEAEKLFVRELRMRVDEYFKIVVRTLRVLIYLSRKWYPKISDISLSVSLRKNFNIRFIMNSSRMNP